MAPFAAIELHERAAVHGLVIDVGQGMESLLDATKLRDALSQARGAFPDLQRTHDAGSGHAAEHHIPNMMNKTTTWNSNANGRKTPGRCGRSWM